MSNSNMGSNPLPHEPIGLEEYVNSPMSFHPSHQTYNEVPN